MSAGLAALSLAAAAAAPVPGAQLSALPGSVHSPGAARGAWQGWELLGVWLRALTASRRAGCLPSPSPSLPAAYLSAQYCGGHKGLELAPVGAATTDLQRWAFSAAAPGGAGRNLLSQPIAIQSLGRVGGRCASYLGLTSAAPGCAEGTGLNLADSSTAWLVESGPPVPPGSLPNRYYIRAQASAPSRRHACHRVGRAVLWRHMCRFARCVTTAAAVPPRCVQALAAAGCPRSYLCLSESCEETSWQLCERNEEGFISWWHIRPADTSAVARQRL